LKKAAAEINKGNWHTLKGSREGGVGSTEDGIWFEEV
jgi:hypothetical protein